MSNARAPAETAITVLVHVHYPDIWQGMSELLAERMELPFHLVLTSSHPQDEIVLPRTPALLSARFLSVENRGRDILPFLRAIAETETFEFGLKLHTKKSPQREDGAKWRAELLDSLLPPACDADTIVTRMRADPRIGIVTPAGFCLSVRAWALTNMPGMRRVMSMLGADLVAADLSDVFFAAGSMFWFRRSALVALADQNVRELFELEEGQLDGTVAHAIERLFPVEARRQGYVSLAVPALIVSRPEMPLPELLDLASRYADVPSSYFPAACVPATPLTVAPGVPPASRWKALLASVYRASLPVGLRRGLRRLRAR